MLVCVCLAVSRLDLQRATELHLESSTNAAAGTADAPLALISTTDNDRTNFLQTLPVASQLLQHLYLCAFISLKKRYFIQSWMIAVNSGMLKVKCLAHNPVDIPRDSFISPPDLLAPLGNLHSKFALFAMWLLRRYYVSWDISCLLDKYVVFSQIKATRCCGEYSVGM